LRIVWSVRALAAKNQNSVTIEKLHKLLAAKKHAMSGFVSGIKEKARVVGGRKSELWGDNTASKSAGQQRRDTGPEDSRGNGSLANAARGGTGGVQKPNARPDVETDKLMLEMAGKL
jgi:hypothetical protein